MPIVTIPHQNNLNRQSGTLVLRLDSETVPESAHLLTAGAFSLWYTGGAFVLRTSPSIESKQLYLYAAPFPGAVTLIWTWIGNNHRLISIGSETNQLAEETEMTEAFGTIDLVVAPYFPGSYVSLATYASDVFYAPADSALLPTLSQSGNLLFRADYTQNAHYEKNPFFEATLVLQDASPILVSDADGPMRRQFFFDFENGDYTDINTETFLYRGEETLYLSYDGLDSDYDVTVLAGTESIGQPLNVVGNSISLSLTEEEKDYWYGTELVVTYRLDRSYSLDYNADTAHDSYKLLLTNHKNKAVTITQEGNRFSNQKLAREIELNPIVSPQHTGFLYLSKKEQISQAFRLNLSSDYVIANGLDSADFIVEAIDQEGNEVLSPYIDVSIMDENGNQSATFGSFVPIMNRDTLKARNIAGRCYFKYQAPLIKKSDNPFTQKIYAVAYDRKNRIGAQVPLLVRPSEPVYAANGSDYLEQKNTLATSPYASLVFEYFARYYEKSIPAGHPILLCDADGDGLLTLADLEQLLADQTNETRMKEIENQLISKEAF